MINYHKDKLSQKHIELLQIHFEPGIKRYSTGFHALISFLRIGLQLSPRGVELGANLTPLAGGLTPELWTISYCLAHNSQATALLSLSLSPLMINNRHGQYSTMSVQFKKKSTVKYVKSMVPTFLQCTRDTLKWQRKWIFPQNHFSLFIRCPGKFDSGEKCQKNLVTLAL